jgi:hypothetical protein
MEDAEQLADRLRSHTDAQLASAKADRTPGNLQVILVDREIARRERLHQHELDLKLIAEQVRWMKFTAILGPVTTIIGIIVGALLTFWLQQSQPPRQLQKELQPAPQQSGASTSGDHTEKAESVPSKNP